MWNRYFCSTLDRTRIRPSIWAHILRPTVFETFVRPSLVRQLVVSSFYRARTILSYTFGRTTKESLKTTLNNKPLVLHKVQPLKVPSILGRIIVGKQFHFRRFQAYFQNGQFRRLNRQHVVTGTGLSFGLIGVIARDENGFPILLPSESKQKFSWDSVFREIKIKAFDLKNNREDINNVEQIKFDQCISKGCAGVVYKAHVTVPGTKNAELPVAVKMMFNYDTESNSMAILNSTIKECLPYSGRFGRTEITNRKKLSPHPNIVQILSVFVDYFKPLDKCRQLYPHALPLQYGGYGRNMTLYMVERLYDMTLKQYLNIFKLSEKDSLAILTQCMDGIDYLNRQNVAHRDLKTDNILVTVSDGESFPWIVISDFGLSATNLCIPFQTDEVCRGGNRALMAPEIVIARPSKKSVLDYSKSDLWALGTIAYEIFGDDNPFYRRCSTSSILDSANYKEDDLPIFPSKSMILSNLVKQILRRDPTKRPTTDIASKLCHILYHMRSHTIERLLKIMDFELRNQQIEIWFNQFFLGCMNHFGNFGCKSFDFKMKLMFATKFNSKQMKLFFEKEDYLFKV
ncbi:protein serine threonine kinase [Blomia tropicalis]|nr:protein serine threonine kinase [Blomia tropicalis]